MPKKEKVYGPLILAPRNYVMYGRVEYAETLPPMLAQELKSADCLDDFIAIIYQLAERGDDITDDIRDVLVRAGYRAVMDYIASGKAPPTFARLVKRTIEQQKTK